MPGEKPLTLSQAQPASPRPTRLLLRQLRASHLGSELEGECAKAGQWAVLTGSWPLLLRAPSLVCITFPSPPGTGDLRCAAELDNPAQQRWTKPVRAGPEVEWTEDLVL